MSSYKIIVSKAVLNPFYGTMRWWNKKWFWEVIHDDLSVRTDLAVGGWKYHGYAYTEAKAQRKAELSVLDAENYLLARQNEERTRKITRIKSLY